MQRRLIIAGLAAGAAAAIASPSLAEASPVLVFAAASLKTALDAIARRWRAETGGRAAVSYAASSALAKQIENGAPAALFISADLDWMDYLQQRGLIEPASRVDLLGNKLVLIVPKDSAAQPAPLSKGFAIAALLGNGRLAVADPAAVPAGKYAKAALTALGLWDVVAGRIAAAENVRAALLLVARGEAPLGIVYQTDAAVEPSVRIVGTFPADSHPPITYPMALIRHAGGDAASFAAYLRGTAAARLFEAQGFTVLAGER